MQSRVGKPGAARQEWGGCLKTARTDRRPGRRVLAVLCSGVLLIGLSACTTGPVRRTVSLQMLESAPASQPPAARRQVVCDLEALRPIYQPLGRRLGLIQVRDADEWEQLARAVPEIGPCPDLGRGIMVGLASATGTPLDGGWPLCWEAIRMHDGAGLIEASFNPGDYFPDGTTYLESAYVENLGAVLVVAVNGVLYYAP